MIGLIVPVPKSVAESGYIKIWADANKNVSVMRGCSWELLAYEYDLETKKTKGEYFAVTKKEVETWISNQPKESDIFGLPQG